jgi:spermidine synthase
MEWWFTEKVEDKAGLTFKIRSIILNERTPYHQIDVLETKSLGKFLLLDSTVRLTERDGFIYHERITHVPLSTHSDPRDLLVIGGDDGGREWVE